MSCSKVGVTAWLGAVADFKFFGVRGSGKVDAGDG